MAYLNLLYCFRKEATCIANKLERGLLTRKPKNVAEGLFYDKMNAEGWTLTKQGWPDFFCVNDKGEFCCVEVKPKATHRLKNNQHEVMRYLQQAGVKCYKWTPDAGFQTIEY